MFLDGQHMITCEGFEAFTLQTLALPILSGLDLLLTNPMCPGIAITSNCGHLLGFRVLCLRFRFEEVGGIAWENTLKKLPDLNSLKRGQLSKNCL